MLKMKILNVLLISANLLAQSEKLINRRILELPLNVCSYSGITAMASPSNIIPCPEKVITLTEKGFVLPIPSHLENIVSSLSRIFYLKLI